MGKRLKRIIKKENFPKFTLNLIRHSWAKRAIKSEVSSSDCAMSMGYSIEVFQDKYLSSIKNLLVMIFKILSKDDERGIGFV